MSDSSSKAKGKKCPSCGSLRQFWTRERVMSISEEVEVGDPYTRETGSRMQNYYVCTGCGDSISWEQWGAIPAELMWAFDPKN
jgi:DNA-directed RNA polymerase subunit RPC12/RpoP